MADTCTCKCRMVYYHPEFGWLGCARGVHCGETDSGCNKPAENVRNQ